MLVILENDNGFNSKVTNPIVILVTGDFLEQIICPECFCF
jgi:hypothetical protein